MPSVDIVEAHEKGRKCLLKIFDRYLTLLLNRPYLNRLLPLSFLSQKFREYEEN